MKALVWHGKEDIRYDTVSDPKIEEPRDAIIKVSSCAICGSDLHLYHNFIPAMLPGDVMGHETMGEIVDLGPEARARGRLSIGDRVVIPFTIICGECDQCKRGNFSLCQRSNRKKKLAEKVFGHAPAGPRPPQRTFDSRYLHRSVRCTTGKREQLRRSDSGHSVTSRAAPGVGAFAADTPATLGSSSCCPGAAVTSEPR